MNVIDRLRAHPPTDQKASGQGDHGMMMMVCCIPMLGIAVVLVATGVASVGFLFVALMCTAMMGMMMRGMNHSDNPR